MFSCGLGLIAGMISWRMPLQWNLLGGEISQMRLVATSTIMALTSLVAALTLMWCFESGHRTRKECWLHPWMLAALLAVKALVYAAPPATEKDWYTNMNLGLLGMSIVLGAWCLVIRPEPHRRQADPHELRA